MAGGELFQGMVLNEFSVLVLLKVASGVNKSALRMAGGELFQGAAWAVKSSPWHKAQQLH